MSDHTLDLQLAAVRREIAMRKNVYPKWVKDGRMKQEKADSEIAAMQAVHDTLDTLRKLQAEILPGKVAHAMCLLASTVRTTMPVPGEPTRRVVGWKVDDTVFQHVSDALTAVEEIARGYRASLIGTPFEGEIR